MNEIGNDVWIGVKMIKPAIIVIAYNREVSLKRLLTSLNNAIYESDDITLIISIDKSDNEKVFKVADEFDWKHGEKKTILSSEKLGLKKHVLKCGDYAYEYESIIVLEDDLYVSKNFYSYACQVLEFSMDRPEIAGISLYNHELNVHVREPFTAIDDGYDNYYMQFAQSWGQAYTKKQWHAFRNWFDENESKSLYSENVPLNVSSWSDKSWLKYFIKYVIDTDKFFIYPRVSHTTNFGDEGTHAKDSVSDLQVMLSFVNEKKYNFSSLDESGSVYDAFFENIKIKKAVSDKLKSLAVNAEQEDISIDLYGYRESTDKRFVLSSKSMPYKVLYSYARRLRPIDANIILDCQGDELFLYDTAAVDNAPKIDEAKRTLYNYKALSVKKMLNVIKYRITGK